MCMCVCKCQLNHSIKNKRPRPALTQKTSIKKSSKRTFSYYLPRHFLYESIPFQFQSTTQLYSDSFSILFQYFSSFPSINDMIALSIRTIFFFFLFLQWVKSNRISFYIWPLHISEENISEFSISNFNQTILLIGTLPLALLCKKFTKKKILHRIDKYSLQPNFLVRFAKTRFFFVRVACIAFAIAWN